MLELIQKIIFKVTGKGNITPDTDFITDLELNSDLLMTEECPDTCGECLRACPVQAIENGTVDQKKCRLNAYGKTSRGFDKVLCNRCRSVCPKRFGK